jgi:hypothetical protein
MRSLTSLISSAAAAALAAGSILLAAPAAQAYPAPAFGGEHPPECVALKVQNPDGTIVHVHACGAGSRGESPVLDAARGAVLTMDGAYLRGRGCGSVALPCVMFWELSPIEGQPTGEP